MSSQPRCSESSFSTLAFLVISLVWRSEPLLPLGMHNYYPHFGVQSHFGISTFIAVVIVRRSKPWFGLAFKVITSSFHSAFKAIVHFPFGVQSHCSFFVWHSKPYFRFGVQSHRSSSIWNLESLLIFRLAFRAIVNPQFGVQGRIFISTSRAITFSVWCSKSLFILVRHSEPLHHSLRCSEPLPILASAFRATTSLILVFRATPLVQRSEPHL